MKNIIPFIVNYSPIKKLAIVPFEKKPDKIYKSFELQYIDGEPYGNGYRIVAYRKDSYVDVYDDISLQFQENEKFNVAEKGLNRHVQVAIKKAYLEKQNNCEYISFSFKDLENRKIDFYIKEFSSKKSIPMNLLAPIGYGSKNPNFLPLFFMYNFDFIRKKYTQIECKIEDKKIKIDKFFMPMNMQFRYYARYSNQCELLEFANTDSLSFVEVDLDNNSYIDKNIEYIFEESNSLSKIIVHLEDGKIEINFSPCFDMNKDTKGIFKICPKKEMGYLEGIYEINRDQDKIYIKLVPQNGWNAVPNSFITKLILNKNSIFCKWCKNYEYIEEIDISKRLVRAKWNNKCR